MASVMVAIWRCTMAEPWSELSIDKRKQAMTSAMYGASLLTRTTVGAGHQASDGTRLSCIFVAPEYAFAGLASESAGKAATQVSEAVMNGVKAAAHLLTRQYMTILLMPGTVPYRTAIGDTAFRAHNLAFASFQGNELCSFGKKTGVGEVSAADTTAEVPMTFQAGLGYGTFTLAGNDFGMEICKDATGTGSLPNAVDIHVVTGQGVGYDSTQGNLSIQNRATKYLIVADAVTPAVYDFTGNQSKAVEALSIKEYTEKTKVYFYKISL